MSYSEAITKNDLKKILGNIGIGTSLSTTVGSFALNSGWTGDEIEVKQFGDVVMVKGYFVKSGGTGTDEIAIGNISGVSLPTSHVRFRVGAGNAAYNATNSGYGILAKSGQLSVKLSSSQTTVTVELTYIAAHSTGGYKYLIDMFHPVGSYYETSDANFNPNTAWGGTWVKMAHNTLLTSLTYRPNGNTTDIGNITIPVDGYYLFIVSWSNGKPLFAGLSTDTQNSPTQVIYDGTDSGGSYNVVMYMTAGTKKVWVRAQSASANNTFYVYKVNYVDDNVNRWHRTA